jgi:hypothetical protein
MMERDDMCFFHARLRIARALVAFARWATELPETYNDSWVNYLIDEKEERYNARKRRIEEAFNGRTH